MIMHPTSFLVVKKQVPHYMGYCFIPNFLHENQHGLSENTEITCDLVFKANKLFSFFII